MDTDGLFKNAEPRGSLPPEPTEDRLYTYEEVARYLQLSTQTIWEWVAKGKVESPRYLGYQARFTREQMIRMGEQDHPPGTFPVTLSPRAIAARKVLEKKREAQVLARANAEIERLKAEREERERGEAALLALASPPPSRRTAAKKPAAPKKPAAKKTTPKKKGGE